MTERQKENVIEYCKANSIEIVKTFEEKMSGAKKNRPVVKQMFEYLEANTVDACVISELSRYGRTNEVTVLTDRLKELKVCLISLKEGIKTINDDPKEDARAEFIINIWAGMNKYELENIRYRVKSGRDYAVLNLGSWTGSDRYPLGYHTIPTYKNTKSKLVINDSERPYVELIFEKFNQGWGTVKIANYLTAQGIPTRTNKSQWARTTITQILTNKLYIGKREYNKSIIDVPELRIVSDHTFNTAQTRLKERKSNSQEFSKNKKYSYLFDKRLIKCTCGKHFMGVYRYDVYKCISKKYARGCDNTSVQMSWLEGEILSYLIEHMSELLSEDATQEQQEAQRISIMLQEQERDRTMQKLQRIRELYTDGAYTKVEYDTKTEQTQATLQKINDTIATLEQQQQISTTIRTAYIKQTYVKAESVEASWSKETLHEIIKEIRADHGTVTVQMINGQSFTLQQPQRLINQYK
jgi:DNA invertase Pin-like site-specific DNA recombinase